MLDPSANELLQIDLGRLHSFFERVSERPWIVAVELLLIGSVVYTVLRFLEGTRGARLVRGVLVILVGSFAVVGLIAGRFEFERINVLYPYFILGVFLVSLVAFQTELRRLLLRVGQGGWLQRWFRTTNEQIEPIVVAVDRLAKKKIGALIAIDRGAETAVVTESGVTVDAAISAELLETLFWPGTPLHDLGVIVRQDRIVAAGCQFPLAESGDVDRTLGSRHRAALGMSQEADAVVVVVSEETGTISVAIHGRLRRALSVDVLRSTLTRELMNKPAGGRGRTDAQHSGHAPAIQKVTTSGTGQAA